jgi:hypothetical protein
MLYIWNILVHPKITNVKTFHRWKSTVNEIQQKSLLNILIGLLARKLQNKWYEINHTTLDISVIWIPLIGHGVINLEEGLDTTC